MIKPTVFLSNLPFPPFLLKSRISYQPVFTSSLVGSNGMNSVKHPNASPSANPKNVAKALDSFVESFVKSRLFLHKNPVNSL